MIEASSVQAAAAVLVSPLLKASTNWFTAVMTSVLSDATADAAVKMVAASMIQILFIV